MRRTPLKRYGKAGLANRESRNIIARICEEKNIQSCELMFPGCTGTFGIAPAHRNRREWYKANVALLSDYKQWVAGCQHCHFILDDPSQTPYDKKEAIFVRLRG